MSDQQPAKLAYSVREAVGLTPYGYERLLAYVNSGQLPAKRERDKDGKPVGKIVILHDDLVKFLESLPAA